MIRRILTLPTGKRTLRAKCQEVQSFDDWAGVLKDLEDTLDSTPNAAGLAAPQIGNLLRIFIVRDGPRILTFINPRILEHGDEMEVGKEGCLSMPGVWVTIPRWTTIRVETLHFGGKTAEARFSGSLARAVQHELDHLNGIMIGQREAEYASARRK